ncbi:hypothetical protein HRbin40_01395 [bacterium HR40]|nr:hypothetical protein HRbin40_01395 [bacterium HR40]
MSVLAERIAALVRAHGPLDVGRFMLLCAAHREGYYGRGPEFGVEGDFVTAPELSQIFGELLGLACIAHWRASGRPQAIRLVELGPGSGTLLFDLWRALATDPACRAAVRSVELVEASAALRERQRQRLSGLPLVFHSAVDQLPDDLPLLVIANEFFDALPMRQYVCTAEGLRERVVVVDAHGRLAFALHPHPLPKAALADPRLGDLAEGAVVELAPAREAVAAILAAKLRRAGGLALVIDYGYVDRPSGDTLQAVLRHARVDPLAHPGQADLSSHVDFRALATAARGEGIAVYGPIAQATFLERLGIRLRLSRLCARASPEQARRLEQGVARLVDPAHMGELFRVLALVAPQDPVPPGFVAGEMWR